MITGMHAIVFSPEAEKVRAFLADILAVHPTASQTRYELYLMCDDIQATLADLRGKGVEVAQDVSDQGWGLLAAIRLPDGSELGVYEPRHPLPPRP